MASASQADDEMRGQSLDEPALPPEQETTDDDEASDSAPRYEVPSRRLAAVELPAVVKNIDRAVKAFGRVPSLSHAMDPTRTSLPLYLNPESPYCPPIMSHKARSHNVVLKVTVPKRTGRKRKLGTDGPWQGDSEMGDGHAASESGVCSIARLDEPMVLRRKLADNVDRYEVEAVGVIKHTHRFRGLADFYWDMSRSPFAQRYANQVLPGDVQLLKDFKFAPGTDTGPNVDIIPPPLFTHMTLPFNYNYSQNPLVRNTVDGDTINTSAVKQVGYFISAEEPAPEEPQLPPDPADFRSMEIIAELEQAFTRRPVWTRRSLINHLGDKLRNWNELKKCLNYTAYQFKGGPWRDGVVPYGVDPRTDPKYRIYQTLMFKLSRRNQQHGTWQSLRRSQTALEKQAGLSSHIFDGESYCTDGKVWQVCDITDPLLKEMLDKAAVRPTWDVNSGWYHGGLWAKVKAIMKTKLVAIQFGRHLTRTDFAATLDCGDQTPTKTPSATFHLPLPNLRLTREELTVLRGREPPKRKSTGYNVRVREPGRVPSAGPTTESSPAAAAAAAQSDVAAPEEMELDGADLGGEYDGGAYDGGEYDGDEDEDGGEYDGDDVDDEEYADQQDYGHPVGRGAGEGYGHEDEEEDVFAAMGGGVYPELD
ncbi:hypothetical protein CDD83_7330 [Cordyceps sp. RAO-2017]|nr:hypothetical protein CDD83_7330 [Cordyceps sp. RAO-2017]